MKQNCPNCKGYWLEPMEIEEGLIVGHCVKCNGNMLPLMNYRYWEKTHGNRNLNEGRSELKEDSSHAKLCPKCSRLMLKFRVDIDTDNRLDLCTACDEAWLDSGEWELLKKMGLHSSLSNIFTEEWQRGLRQKQKVNAIQERYIKSLGEDDFDRVNTFKGWMEQHECKEEIKLYINTNLNG